jgi:hypothetical protein
MDRDQAKRAAAIVSWSFTTGQRPSKVYGPTATVDLEFTELSHGRLITTDSDSNKVIQADMNVSPFYVDYGTDSNQLYVEPHQNPIKVEDRYNKVDYRVEISGNTVKVKGPERTEKFEVY